MRKRLAIFLCILLTAFGLVSCGKPQETRPETVTQYFHLDGYQKTRYDENLENWLLVALDDNPGIIQEYRDKTMLFKAMWFGEFSGKLLMSIAYAYSMEQDERTLAAGKKLVDELADVQTEAGYLGPFGEGYELIGNEMKTAWDLWGNYHNIMALEKWYELTGYEKARSTAIAALDFIIDFMSKMDRDYIDADWAEMNLSITHAFAYFYNLTGDERYLTEALRILNKDWESDDKGGGGLWEHRAGDWYNVALSGKEFYEGRKPRWEALHAIMALGELYKATGEESYYIAMENTWWSILKTDVHNNGSFSSGEAACNNAYNNALPIETCCTIAWMEFSLEYLKLSKNSRVADELERSNINAMYAAQMQLSEENKQYFTYDTPMDGKKISAFYQLRQGEKTSPDVSCCQLNGPKAPSFYGQWGTLQDNTGIYLNYYGESEITTVAPSKKAVTIKQTTGYPVNGNISVSVECESERFALYLRIPSWSQNTKVKLNGASIKNVESGQYLKIDNVWKNDTIEIELDMSVHFLKGQQTYNESASVYYGPVMLGYNLSEWTDSPAFSKADFEGITVTAGTDSWLTAIVESNGKQYVFKDYGSLGKGGKSDEYTAEYRSWHRVSGLTGLIFGRDRIPLWSER